MRRSASPSKAARSGGGNSTPSRPLHRTGGDDSANVLKAAFKPLSGLGSRRQSSLPPEDSSASSAAADPTPIPNPSLTPTREASRAKSVPELEAEVAAMEESLADILKAHNAKRTSKDLPPQEADQIVSEYITLLTQYNKVKDSTQVVFDKIAEIEQLPAKAIHERYGVGSGEE